VRELSEKIRLGFIGAGWMFKECLAPAFSQNSSFELVSLSNRDSQAGRLAGESFAILAHYENWLEMLDKERLDAVVISTPPYLHKEMTVECVNRDLHVLCEKPCAMNAAETNEMITAARKAGVFLHFGMCYRHMDASIALRNVVQEGWLGKIYFGKAGWLNQTRPFRVIDAASWKQQHDKAGGGTLMGIGVHTIDRSLWAMGYPKPKSVYCKTFSELNRELAGVDQVEDLAIGIIELANGVTLYIENSQLLNGEEVFYYNELYGTDGGTRIYRDKQATWFQRTGCEVSKKELVDYVEFEPDIIYQRQADLFANGIVSHIVAHDQHAEMLCLMGILDAMYESACSEEIVRFD
jgi:predicted dehydrogenase